MHTISARDGTTIACRVSGDGPPLVVVHGTAADHGRWMPILPELEKHFTVYALDRRGRGLSGDGPSYAIDREFEDIAAVIDSLAGPVRVLAHSYGAMCALEAALLTDNIAKLVLYEPPLPTGTAIYPPGLIDRLEKLLAVGDREAVVQTFFTEVVRMPPHELAQLKALPAWPGRVAAAHTIARELRAHEGYVFVPERFQNLGTPTLLLLGKDSPPFFGAAVELARQAIVTSRVDVLPGQQHTAINTAPQLFLEHVLPFLGASPG